jgi:hypothetical protein
LSELPSIQGARVNILPSSRDTDLESSYRARYGIIVFADKSLILLLHKESAVVVIYSIAVCKFV